VPKKRHKSREDGESHAMSHPLETAHAHDHEASGPTKRLDVFILDTGWNAAVSTALMHNLDMIRTYLEEDDVYILDRAQSVAILKRSPHIIGHDPVILFLDRKRKDAGHEKYGLRLNLGLLKKADQALARLQAALRIVAENRSCPDMYHAVQKDLWHAGLEGAVQVISESALEIV
jgi:hypothetical protein